MEARDVLSLPWKKVTDWSELPTSSKEWGGDNFVSEADVDIFVQNIYRDIARKINFPYAELKRILVDENSAFYFLKRRLFGAGNYYGKKSPRLIQLESTLRIPDISNLENAAEDGVSKCLKLFDGLSDIEKTMFLQKIGKINIKVEVECFAEETAVN